MMKESKSSVSKSKETHVDNGCSKKTFAGLIRSCWEQKSKENYTDTEP